MAPKTHVGQYIPFLTIKKPSQMDHFGALPIIELHSMFTDSVWKAITVVFMGIIELK